MKTENSNTCICEIYMYTELNLLLLQTVIFPLLRRSEFKKQDLHTFIKHLYQLPVPNVAIQIVF